MKKLIVFFFVLSFSPVIWASDDDDSVKLTAAFNLLSGKDGYTNYDRAYDIFKTIYYSTALSSRKKARANHIYAEYGLGLCLYRGFGIKQNYYEAYRHFWSLVMLGVDNYIPDAGYFYGECCYNGYGTSRNLKDARVGFYHSAMFGSSLSRIKLGVLMLKGEKEIVSENDSEVFGWVREEAAKNNSEAQYVLGHLYLRGNGCSKDTLLALAYFEKSANNNNEEAMYTLVHNFYLPDYGSKFKDHSKAFLYINKLANNGDAYSQYDLGVCYAMGRGTEKNEGLALQWYEKAANGGCPDALSELGNMYYEGRNVQKNNQKALSYYMNYLQHEYDRNPHGNALAIRVIYVKSKIGDIYYEGGYGVSQDYEQAVKYYLKAADAYQISAKSAKNLAICYKWGYGGLLPSNKKSEEWLQKAKELGDKEAREMLRQ